MLTKRSSPQEILDMIAGGLRQQGYMPDTGSLGATDDYPLKCSVGFLGSYDGGSLSHLHQLIDFENPDRLLTILWASYDSWVCRRGTEDVEGYLQSLRAELSALVRHPLTLPSPR